MVVRRPRLLLATVFGQLAGRRCAGEWTQQRAADWWRRRDQDLR